MFPAPAGMSPLENDVPEAAKYVPRTRGDEPLLPRVRLTYVACSPHPRG